MSIYFPLPYYQDTAFVPAVPDTGFKPGFAGRGVPDVAGNADPDSGYQIFANGQWNIIAGTSAVAPLWPALYALLSQSLGQRIGFANPHLYEHNGTAVFRDITEGGQQLLPGRHRLGRLHRSWLARRNSPVKEPQGTDTSRLKRSFLFVADLHGVAARCDDRLRWSAGKKKKAIDRRFG